MISPRNKRILLQLLPFGIIPAIFSVVQSMLEKGILGDHPIYPSTGNPYQFKVILPMVISMIIGFLIGAFEFFYVNRWFQSRSFAEKLIFKSFVYVIAIVIATVFSVVLGHAISEDLGILDPKVWSFAGAFFSNFAFWSIVSYYSLAIISSLFYVEVSNSIGQAVSLNFFTGKYHHPKVEERTYMFLDMNASTTIAEKLGHIRYFEMLKAYYADLSAAIVEHGGEIYQYVGDEIVITWKVRKNFALDCLDCFFKMKEALEKKKDEYLTTYGVVPSFKAGIHYGRVTTGEIGVIKKDIAFSGDVLNTTSRIQSLCNKFQVDILASEKFIRALPRNGKYELLSIGESELRGKDEKINLFTVRKIRETSH